MKCVCGHSDYELGSEQFKTIWLDKEDRFVAIEKMDSYNRYYFEPTTIYACPICGTLKIEI